ncbi:TetR/AcrR family transcriptional regulator [Sphingomonadales bacterium 56]|uniref:TetR/AcrR family transcriptional regulator n=1 Tax=unclassified Sphingobium TaxID=2611147 RepID=UPI001917D37F|nr:MULTISPECIES: TetR/AcrR family transcriptional regulator [unclassified Sphingobium]MBY2930180.1 TetR/AcrR family transcriptional regulator [Sphingomonadales bacterium 56]MBY2959935.1 TetR/AcrR family transcriptional regulator [Sphingomonadales bacterium 58]CAD7339978.1 HTH-type transcriptional regulator BetI [Sphingobium sp. S8]CAD7340877.1 HTH-type transcriptional regulator BetI [Sphingobium sp. S6]
MKLVAEGRGEVASPRVRHLLLSARAQFVERGFDAVSIDSIARTAGVSKETIYRYFADKEALFRAALEAQGAEFDARAAAVHESAATGGSELAGLARVILDSALDQGMFSALWVAAGVAHKMPDLAASLQSGQGMRLEPVRQALEDHAREKGIDRPVPLELALDFGSLAVEGPVVLMGFPAPSPEGRERAARHAVALFVQGAGGSGAAGLPPPEPLADMRFSPFEEPLPHIRTLLDVAGRHFLQEGFEGANLNLIGEEARVGRGTLYRHFGSKAGLFAGAMRILASDCACGAKPPVLPLGRADPVALRRYVEAALESLTSTTSIRLHRAVISQSRRDAALAREVYLVLRKPWVDGLIPWLESLGIKESAEWHARQLLVLAMRGNRLLAGGHPVAESDRRYYAERAATIFLHGYLATL